MKSKWCIIVVIFFLLAVSTQAEIRPDSLSYGAFGTVKIYKPKGIPTGVVLFLSGDGGWNAGVVDMTQNILLEGAFVIGIDIRHYRHHLRMDKSRCIYPAGDLEMLSMMVQKRYNFQKYYKPILVGYSSGATWVYGILAQAPANTFKGAISLGFCPDYELNKPFCEGSGLRQYVFKPGKSYYLEPTESLTAPFIVLLGLDDQVCLYKDIEQFMKKVKMGELVALPKVGHGFSVPKNWLPEFVTAYKRIESVPSYAEQVSSQSPLLREEHLRPDPVNVPITVIPTAVRDSLPLAIFISGDGGWTSFDQAICQALSVKGVPVIGVDAQKYFWKYKSPEVAAADLTKVFQQYAPQWKKRRFTLIGYSFGACVVPFVAERLPMPVKNNLESLFCLSPDESADFEIHVADMLSLGSKKDIFDVLAEIRKVGRWHPVCVFGDKESVDLRGKFAQTGARILTLPGNHHYNHNANAVAELLFNEIKAFNK